MATARLAFFWKVPARLLSTQRQRSQGLFSVIWLSYIRLAIVMCVCYILPQCVIFIEFFILWYMNIYRCLPRFPSYQLTLHQSFIKRLHILWYFAMLVWNTVWYAFNTSARISVYSLFWLEEKQEVVFCAGRRHLVRWSVIMFNYKNDCSPREWIL